MELEIQRINLLVVLTGKSQATLARQLQISRGRLNHYLTGRRVLDEMIKISICKYFGVPERILTQKTVHLILVDNKLKVVDRIG